MLKKTLFVSAFALSALVSSAFAQAYLDVIIRDFPVGHPGFEEFDIDKGTSGECAKPEGSSLNSSVTANQITNTGNRNQMCFSGNDYMTCDKGGTALMYGQGQGQNENKRGFTNGPDRADDIFPAGATHGNGISWFNTTWVTVGMVQERLDYSLCQGEERAGADESVEQALAGRYCARPRPTQNAKCYGSGLSSWFTDGGAAKTLYDVITLEGIGGSFFEIDHNYNKMVEWNEHGEDNGYFPLDKYDWVGHQSYQHEATHGKQSLNVWCPRRDYGYDLGRNCYDWREGNSYPIATEDYARSKGLLRKWHNYGFTMAGSGEFKYVKDANDVFEFIGDDDMWIFIDGKLEIDLGGTHTAAPGKIDIEKVGRERGWADGSKHAINFYYADRQTDGSNMRLRMSLSDLSPARFGAPFIQNAETIIRTDGTSQTLIWTNNKIDLNHIRKFIGSDQFPIIIRQQGNVIRGYQLHSIEGPTPDGSKGFIYSITGVVCTARGVCETESGNLYTIPAGSQVLSFNVREGDDIESGGYSDPGNFGFPKDNANEWYIRSENNIMATTKMWAPHKLETPPVGFDPIPGDDNPLKPPFNVDQWFTGGNVGTLPEGGKLGGTLPGGGNFKIDMIWDPKTGTMVSVPAGSKNSNGSVSGFGTKGTVMPPNKTGELILTAYPNASNKEVYEAWLRDPEKQKYFGIPPTAYGPDMPYGVADPSVPRDEGGYMFVKNGFPGESSTGNIQVAPTRCISDRSGPEPRINCLNFSLKAKQPFQLAVTVYDQLGNFVTQYRETVSEQDFRRVVQTPGLFDPAAAEELAGENGNNDGTCTALPADSLGHPHVVTLNHEVKVNINIYPFSANGRRFGNGVYILKIDRVDLPYGGCVNAGGMAVWTDEKFIRYHADTRFGWMRACKNKDCGN